MGMWILVTVLYSGILHVEVRAILRQLSGFSSFSVSTGNGLQ